jgi:hypothetical protein
MIRDIKFNIILSKFIFKTNKSYSIVGEQVSKPHRKTIIFEILSQNLEQNAPVCNLGSLSSGSRRPV